MDSADFTCETSGAPLDEGADFVLLFCFDELDRRDMASSATCNKALRNFKCRLNTSSEYHGSLEAEPATREIPASGSANDSSCAGQESFRLLRNPLSCGTGKRPVRRRAQFVRFLMSRLTLKSAIFSDGFIQLSIGDLPVTIGRSHRADIAINDLLLSRIHAEIRVSDNGEFELVDNESTNLTIVNEQDIDRVILKTGDKILLGDTELIVEIEMDQSNLHERTTREIPSFKPPEP